MRLPTQDRVAALGRVPLFSGVLPGPMERVASSAAWLAVEPGHLVMDFDDPSTDVVFILQGTVRVSVQTSGGGHTRILGDFRAGEFVGEMAAIDAAPRSARVEALVRAQLCLVPAGAFLQAVADVPAVGLRVMRLLTARIRAQNGALLEHTALSTRLRVAVELLRVARPRGDGTLVISPPPIQEELANRIGARRETISREMGALARAGLLRRTATAIVLPDPAALEAAVRRGMEGKDV